MNSALPKLLLALVLASLLLGCIHAGSGKPTPTPTISPGELPSVEEITQIEQALTEEFGELEPITDEELAELE